MIAIGNLLLDLAGYQITNFLDIITESNQPQNFTHFVKGAMCSMVVAVGHKGLSCNLLGHIIVNFHHCRVLRFKVPV